MVVYLAWFSCLTHLSCLTVLRSYLYRHTGERLWRIVAMFIVVLSLIVSMIPTSKFNWIQNGPVGSAPEYSLSSPNITVPAKCAFEHGTPTHADSLSTMITSMSLLAIGFCTRAIRLHKWAMVSVIKETRKRLSDRALELLHRMDAWSNAHIGLWQAVTRTLVYRPTLAAFLVIRATLDLYGSMFFEVQLPGFKEIHITDRDLGCVAHLQLYLGNYSSFWNHKLCPVLLA
jgi:hypothetical protein